MGTKRIFGDMPYVDTKCGRGNRLITLQKLLPEVAPDRNIK
jgi:hypothetical protein